MINSIGYQAGLNARLPISAHKAPEGPHKGQPVDHYISEENTTLLKMGTLIGATCMVIFGVPAAAVAVAGGWGVAGSALTYGALASLTRDDSEYPMPRPGNVSQAALVGGGMATVGLLAGTAGVVGCAALGAAVGALMIAGFWEHESKK